MLTTLTNNFINVTIRQENKNLEIKLNYESFRLSWAQLFQIKKIQIIQYILAWQIWGQGSSQNQ